LGQFVIQPLAQFYRLIGTRADADAAQPALWQTGIATGDQLIQRQLLPCRHHAFPVRA
jgi:hypothetical protein